jgi:uncharacterized protein involved in high-affinity Fe2+ transport
MTSTEETKALRDGMRYVATTNVNQISAALGLIKLIATIKNPSASPIKLIIDTIKFFSPTNTIPTDSKVFVGCNEIAIAGGYAQIQPINLCIGSPKVDATTSIRGGIGTTALSGGNSVPYELPTSNNDEVQTKQFMLLPGQTVGFEFTRNVTVAVNVSMYLMIYYIAEPA